MTDTKPAPPAVEDDALIRRYLDTGCGQAANQLAERHVARVHALIRSMVLDDGVADDLTQETFLRAFGKLNSFQGQATFTTWLFRIAMNQVHSHLERKQRSPVVFRSDVPESAIDHSPERRSQEFELRTDIEEALAALPPKLRAAIVLTRLQGKTTAEAAEIEGCGVPAMYWRVHAARRKLKKRLARHLS